MNPNWHHHVATIIIIHWFIHPTTSFPSSTKSYLFKKKFPQPSNTKNNPNWKIFQWDHQLDHIITTATTTTITTTTLKANVDLTTSLEWLANEKENEYNKKTNKDLKWWNDFHIQWLDPSKPINETKLTTSSHHLLRMPLYPLNACYMPSQSTQILNNVEPRNIRMAQVSMNHTWTTLYYIFYFVLFCFSYMLSKMKQDLEQGMYNDFFCVTLRTHDTGHIANVGTIMKAIHFDTQYHPNQHEHSDKKHIKRIIVTCQPIQRVQIQHIENTMAWSLPNRIMKSDDYLIAQVEPLLEQNQKQDQDQDQNQKQKQKHERVTRNDQNDPIMNQSQDPIQWIDELIQDYSMIRYTYKSQDPIAVGSLPPFAVNAMKDIPPITREGLLSIDTFWNCVEIWQNVCYTIREAKRVMIQSDMNEIMIDAAMKKGGPLNLPVHKEDLSIDVQRKLECMEQTARMEFIDSGLDPCLDFQFLLSCNQPMARWKLFRHMISRERKRLEAKKKLNFIHIDESFQ